MHLFLQRESGESKATLGTLSVDGEYYCRTLEPMYINPGIKVQGQTAIPAGQYLIRIYDSPHFHRPLPLIMGIPNFTEILIHAGNRVDETRGCILIGFQRGNDDNGPVIWESRKAIDTLMARMLEAEKRQVIAITVKDADA